MAERGVVDLYVEGKRQLDICNSCRYCEGYCAVFPALERRLDLTKADMVQLANLCHDCRECFYACMYAPPHEFGVNPPQLFAKIRREHADELSTFGGVSRRERTPCGAAALSGLAMLALVVVIAAATVGLSGLTATHHGAASPYTVLSYPAILALGIASLALGVGWMVAEAWRFWRASGSAGLPSPRELARAARAAALLENLGGGGEGCAYPSEETSPVRRLAHTGVAWGFALCLFATISASVLQDFLGAEPPYGWLSAPVLLGTIGGVGLVVGSVVLFALKRRVDPAPSDVRSAVREFALLGALFLLGAGGLLTLLLRSTSLYGIVLALHLATVFACFMIAPFTKFTHAAYRLLALARDEREQGAEREALAL